MFARGDRTMYSKNDLCPKIITRYRAKDNFHLSHVMRIPAFCICKNKDADQLRGNRQAVQRLCFRYNDSTIPLLPKSEISSLYASSVAVQPGLCRTWSETPRRPVFSRQYLLGFFFSNFQSFISKAYHL